MRYLALVQVLFYVALAAIAFAAFMMLRRWLNAGDGAASQIGNALKDSPLGIPARGIDATISAATGREETLGGWFAELFDPATRQANAEITAAKRIKPTTVGVISDAITATTSASDINPYSINPRVRN